MLELCAQPSPDPIAYSIAHHYARTKRTPYYHTGADRDARADGVSS